MPSVRYGRHSRMKTWFLFLLAVAQAIAADPPDPADLKAKARTYLDAASGMVAATPPEFQSGALLQLGSITSTFDPQRALELYEQALAASAVLPTQTGYRVKEEFQSLLCAQVAKINIDRAIEILTMIQIPPSGEPDPRGRALRAITLHFLAAKQVDKAIEMVDRLSLGGTYPFDAVTLILKALPPADDRRQNLFSQAQASFQQRPEVEPFNSFIRTFRKEMTIETFQSSVRALGKAAVDGKGLPEPHSQTIVAPKGTMTLTDPRDVEIFNVLDLIADVDPAWAREVTASRPGLQQVLERYPRGPASMDGRGETMTTRGTIKPGQSKSDIEARARVLALETLKAQETMSKLQKDPAGALAAIAQIPTPLLQVKMIETVAYFSGSKPPEEARPLLGKCAETLSKVAEPDYRANAWGAIALNAAKAQDMQLAVTSLDKGVADARVMLKKDADPDSPNLAPRSAWPSTQMFKLLFYRAAKALGADAEALLERIPDAEIQIMARVEMAGAWLEAPGTPSFSQTRRAEKR